MCPDPLTSIEENISRLCLLSLAEFVTGNFSAKCDSWLFSLFRFFSLQKKIGKMSNLLHMR